MTLADRIYDAMGAEPMSLMEILMAVKRTGWLIPGDISNALDLTLLFVKALRHDPRFERVQPGRWRKVIPPDEVA